MATFRLRLPSRPELLYGLAVSAVPVHVWLIVNFLLQAKGIAMRLSSWDFMGVIAYVLAFGLLESVVLFVLLLLLAMMLPQRLVKGRFVALATITAFIGSVWFIMLHVSEEIIESRNYVLLAAWGVSFVLALAGAGYLVHRATKVRETLELIAQRLAVLAGLYLVVDLLGLALVIIRNV